MDEYSNVDKLMAVVDYWSKPLIAQLPPQLALLSPVMMPVLRNFLTSIPDSTIPQVARAVVDSAIKQGGIRIWNIRLNEDDLVPLRHLLDLNLPGESVKQSGYCVITE